MNKKQNNIDSIYNNNNYKLNQFQNKLMYFSWHIGKRVVYFFERGVKLISFEHIYFQFSKSINNSNV